MDDKSALSSGGIHELTARSILSSRTSPLLFLLFLLTFIFSCTKDENITDENGLRNEAFTQTAAIYEQTNLVSDVSEYTPVIIDTNLVNAWGIAISPSGTFWISAADKHLSVVYNDEGETLRPPVTMDGYPTGQVFNNTSGFEIPSVGAARFIFVTEDGKITAWRTGNVAQTIIDDADEGASYTGAELAMNGSQPLLYVANVAEGSIDVYDAKWNEIKGLGFVDPSLPADAKPFNIQLVYGQLYVTYTQPNSGLVNVFNTNGQFVKRFATGDRLNEPWGITATPALFGMGRGVVLVGNFGDGRINIFNSLGQFKGQLSNDKGMPITIDGLWALEFTQGAFTGASDMDLYFTAGPDDEEHGIFGEIELEGNTSATVK